MLALGLAPALTAIAFPLSALADDPRMREIAYAPQSVTTLNGCFGFQSTVVFAPGERIENIALGDAGLWQAVPNKQGNLLFLKPAVHSGRTNMMVVTDRRRYPFDLIARDDVACRTGRGTYELRFAYPAEPSPPPAPVETTTPAPALPQPLDLEPAPPPPAARNTLYTFTGNPANVPMRAFDDGHSTWLQWAEGVASPAIYALGPGKTETLLNYAIRGDYLVVDGVGPAFVLRRGAMVAVLYNDGYQQPKLDADAPRPREKARKSARRSLVARLFNPTAASPAAASQENDR
jgi:type IV secretion system protein VirB9